MPDKLELTKDQVDALAIANAQFERSWANIATVLTSAVLPGLTQVTQSVNDYLKTEGGKKFAADLGKVADDIAKSISAWIKEGGLQLTLETLKAAFEAADAVIKSIGLSWPQAIAGLVAINFAGWLTGVGGALRALVPFLPILLALKDIAHLWGKSPTQMQEELDKQKETPAYKALEQEGMIGALLKTFQEWFRQQNQNLDKPKPQPQSGEGLEKTEQERRADLQEEKNQRELLKQEFASLTDELAQVNA